MNAEYSEVGIRLFEVLRVLIILPKNWMNSYFDVHDFGTTI